MVARNDSDFISIIYDLKDYQRERRHPVAETKVTEDDVRHVAHLSRLDCSDEETRRFTHDLNQILGYMDQLAQLDTEGIAPTSHSLKLQNVFREDEVRPSLAHEQALANAPDREGPFFKVPQIIQES